MATARETSSLPQRMGVGLGALAAAGLLAGCISSSRHITDTPRSATEQLLVTTAAERAVDALAWPELRGRRVGVEVVSRNEQDAAYLKAALEAKARELGATVVPSEEAEWVVDVRAGTLGTERRELSVGLPQFPTPFGATPGIAFYDHLRRRGWAQLRLEVRSSEGGRLASSGPALGRAFRSTHRVLLLVIDRDDIFGPEAEAGAGATGEE